MVERRPFADLLTHVLLVVGVVLVALPVWLAFVASTLSSTQVLEAPMSLLPGPELIANYRSVLFEGSTPLRTLLFNSAVSALIIATGKIVISVLWENSGLHGQYAAPIARDIMKSYFDKKVRQQEAELLRRNPGSALAAALAPPVEQKVVRY